MSPLSLGKTLDASLKTGDEVSLLNACFSVDLSGTLHHANSVQSCPFLVRVPPAGYLHCFFWQLCCNGRGQLYQTIPPLLNAAVVFLRCLIILVRLVLELTVLFLQKETLHILMQRGLISFKP